MLGMLIAVFLLILAIVVGGTTAFFGGTVATVGMAISFGLFCIALILGVIGALIET